MDKAELNTGSAALCAAGKETPVILLLPWQGFVGVGFPKEMSEEEQMPLGNTSSFGLKGWHLETESLTWDPYDLKALCKRAHTSFTDMMWKLKIQVGVDQKQAGKMSGW